MKIQKTLLKVSLVILLLASLTIPAFAGVYDLSYDSNQNRVQLNYDSLGRIAYKTTNTSNISYNYDIAFNGTLFNITYENISIRYYYDNKSRIIREIRIIDGMVFEKNVTYDSQDRVISKRVADNDINLTLNKIGKIQRIADILLLANYNSFGSVLNKSYANNINSSFSYYQENNRLKNIVIPNVQNLTYKYDGVGNIVNITDPINARNHDLRYDTLDRLIEAKVGSDSYKYFFNAIGNILNISKNEQSKVFMFAGKQAHAPSNITSTGTKQLFIQDGNSNNVSSFDDEGNIILKGVCISTGACTPTSKSFIIRNSTDGAVAYINETGDMCISVGTCTGGSATCNPSNDAFIVQDSTGKNVSYIDKTGDLCLIGTLTQNGSP